MADGVVTAEEVEEQAARVSTLLHQFEKTATPEQVEQMREILAELSVLVAVNNMR